ncbi:immunity protein Imm33 domain-containing protein [Paraburkholderia bannensis]|uniref:immunity protein Imm33 domain-containing protein n=1 Tax=Paraburkholderia bannensis TaxID=765414 RepID=UPI002ABD4400|nr:hypothetical protein [Paraburkholderia bannensis]
MNLRSLFRSVGSTQTTQQPSGSTHRTANCKRHDHPEIQCRLSDPAIPAEDISWLLRFFERRVADGERFQAGETVQIGWMLTKLEAVTDDLLCITEPDMQAIPIKFVDSVDSTLKHLRNQKDVVASIAPTPGPDFPSLQQSAVVHPDYKSIGGLLLTRNPSHQADSGWSLTDPDDEAHAQAPSRHLRISLYQLGVDRPDLIKFLALPPDLRVRLDNGQIRVTGSDGEIQPLPGSYLDALNKRRKRPFSE